MSWSAYYIGTPDKLVEALQKQSESLIGNSKAEFDAALPHITAMIQQNKGKDKPPVLNLAASGSAYDGQSSCIVKIENLGSVLL